ncbi:hypothetical protein V8G54_013660, partial [Vigna mungo]
NSTELIDMRTLYPTVAAPLSLSNFSLRTNFLVRCSNLHSQPQLDTRKLVLSVKEKLEKEHRSLPVGRNGRDDEDMILWFLKDRKFSVEDAISKLTKAIGEIQVKRSPRTCQLDPFTIYLNYLVRINGINFLSNLCLLLVLLLCFLLYKKWRQDFEVSKLTDETVKDAAQTGKGYVHDFLDINDRPVLVVVGSKHIPMALDPADDERLCVFLIEKALSKLPTGKEKLLGIVDLRGFRTENADLKFLTFLVIFDVFYYYYPKRLDQVLFVDAPFVFKPIWQLAKPLLKSYASLVRFCSAETVRKEYFTEETLPPNFRD